MRDPLYTYATPFENDAGESSAIWEAHEDLEALARVWAERWLERCRLDVRLRFPERRVTRTWFSRRGG